MSTKRFLVKHVGNMGDMVFLVPPALEVLKKKYPGCHITLVTVWGFKKNRRSLPFFKKVAVWGERNQGGHCIALMMTNPHVDQLVHFHSTQTALDESICTEEGKSFPTWSAAYYEEQKASGDYDGVFELDMGLRHTGNPMNQVYNELGIPDEDFSNYRLYFTEQDRHVAKQIMNSYPKPRIVLLEGIEGTSTRGWDPKKITTLEKHITETYNVDAMWFGSKYQPKYNGRSLTLRENIATLLYADVAIGVLSGPLHFAAAVGLPTITLYGDHPLHRAAPAYFLNPYITEEKKMHRTVLGPTNYSDIRLLKDDAPFVSLTPAEAAEQDYISWVEPGKQATKSCLSVITSEEVSIALADAL